MIQDEPISTGDGSAKRNVNGGCTIALKVVPGSRKDEVVGAYGERLKVKVASPPEDGRTNRAVCALLAARLGIAARSVRVVAGATHPEKTVHVEGVSAAEARARLGL
jgi:uncharacterized protein (TIGR00251 family)